MKEVYKKAIENGYIPSKLEQRISNGELYKIMDMTIIFEDGLKLVMFPIVFDYPARFIKAITGNNNWFEVQRTLLELPISQRLGHIQKTFGQ